ncbi:MAG: DUF1801 domain-containing protein [Saprospiraceae bacterium]
MKKKISSIDEYLSTFPVTTQELLTQIRNIIKKAVPLATETIKYDIPTFLYKGNLIHFAAYAKHIGIYPIPQGDEKFNQTILKYMAGKSTVQLPLDKPLPRLLIKKLAEYRKVYMDQKAINKKAESLLFQGVFSFVCIIYLLSS